ncbi:hypothetical protein HaLaN_24435, partial [Haematococcus lacustris]
RIGESRQRPIELCQWDDLEALPPVGKEYQQGYKRVNDRLPKAVSLAEHQAVSFGEVPSGVGFAHERATDVGAAVIKGANEDATT